MHETQKARESESNIETRQGWLCVVRGVCYSTEVDKKGPNYAWTFYLENGGIVYVEWR